MNNTHKLSLNVTLALLFLISIFFLPFASISVGVSKVILLTITLAIALIAILIGSFRKEEIALPNHALLLSVIFLPVIYFASALASDTPWLSLFGYSFEPGTASSILILFVVMLIVSLVFSDKTRLVKGYSAIFLSLVVLALFAVVKVVSGGSLLSFSHFPGIMGNPVGAWTDYAVVLGLLAIISLLALGTLTLNGWAKWVAVLAFVLSVLLLAIINFSTVWVILLIFSIVLLIYFATVERRVVSEKNRLGMVASGVLVVVSLIFVFNPTVSSVNGPLSNSISNFFGISNTFVRPTLSTTLEISSSAIRENPILGPGPNTFSKSWFLYKPVDVNNTQFWNVAFPFGVGFVPTQLSSTGILGILGWIIFFVLFVMLGIKSLVRSPEDRLGRFLVIGSLFASLFLWLSIFIYMPSLTVLTLTFVFSGLLIASGAVTGVVGSRTVVFSRNALTHFISVLIIVALVLGTIAFGFVAYQKTASQIYFQKALISANSTETSLEEIESNIVRAINLSPVDTFWLSLSEIELARANNALSATTGTVEENTENFQAALARAISYSQEAISLNATYFNWTFLGNIYSSLVPAPLSVSGAYDSAASAFGSAKALNPHSPEVPLLLARLELSNNNTAEARNLIEESLGLKSDYADAYFFLSRLEVGQNNLTQAIRSAETGVLLSPGNAGVRFQLGILKYENEDFLGAVESLSSALALVPDYANAKFYLGLSLDQLGRKDDAIKQFEDLLSANPDNELVIAILENLRAGQSALAGLETDSGTTPPISGQ